MLHSRVPRVLQVVLAALMAMTYGCATGSGDAELGDAAVTVDPTDSGPPSDVPSFDVVSPFADTGSAIDAGSPVDTGGAVDAGSPVDTPATTDAGTTVVDAGSPATDAGTADAGVVTPADAGCSGGQTACGGACTDLLHDAHNCGACGTVCTEVQTCTDGACIGTCASPRMFCGTGAAMRCADLQTDTANCGACGHACPAGNMCAAAVCAMAACANGTADCNHSAADGCEVVHATTSLTCAAPTNIGGFCGDTSCGFLCPSTGWTTVATQTGTHAAWFHARSNECSNCPASLSVRLTLSVPAGVDYDLFVYRPCGTVVGSSSATSGMTDTVTITQPDNYTGDDSFDYVVEVRWYSGSSCSPWTLTVETHGRGSC